MEIQKQNQQKETKELYPDTSLKISKISEKKMERNGLIKYAWSTMGHVHLEDVHNRWIPFPKGP